MLWAGNDLDKIGYCTIAGSLVARHMVAKGDARNFFFLIYELRACTGSFGDNTLLGFGLL